MIIVETTSKIDIYSINQIVDILLYSWIFLIMIKRTICNKFHPPITIKNLWNRRHFLSDILFLLASIGAVCQFSDQFYAHLIDIKQEHSMLSRTFVWMLFHKLIEVSILLKYRNSQPKVFYIIKEEIESIFNKFKSNDSKNIPSKI